MMSDERRHAERVPLSLEVRWESLSGRQASARISDISLNGCYVESLAQVAFGERVRLEVNLPTGRWMPLNGEVVYQHPNVGFGLRFGNLSEVEQRMIAQLIEYARED